MNKVVYELDECIVPKSSKQSPRPHSWEHHYKNVPLNDGGGGFRFCVQLFVTSWTVARHALLCMRFPRQEYWSGLPFPSPGDLPDPGVKPGAPTPQVASSLLSHQGNP